MATVIFDFDSTLINCESLEEILKSKGVPQEQFESITKEGMEGKIPFIESLKKRLSLAKIELEDIKAFGLMAVRHLTPGLDTLIESLKERGFEIYIISGSFKEAIYPVADRLKVSRNQVLALNLEGPYLNKRDLAIQAKWSRPAIIVGDGITDYELVESGFADKFVLFTQHIRRDAVLMKGEEARSVEALDAILKRYEKKSL